MQALREGNTRASEPTGHLREGHHNQVRIRLKLHDVQEFKKIYKEILPSIFMFLDTYNISSFINDIILMSKQTST